MGIWRVPATPIRHPMAPIPADGRRIYCPGDRGYEETRQAIGVGVFAPGAAAARRFFGGGGPTTPDMTDSFNRADTVNNIGTLDTGQAWSQSNGTWGIQSNSGYKSAVNNNNQTCVVGTAFVANCEVSVVTGMGTVSSGGGPVARWTDNNNYILFAVDPSSGWGLYRVQAGSFNLIANGSGTTAQGSTLMLRCSGNTITVLRNGTQLGQVTESFNNTATSVGLNAYNTNFLFDSFLAHAI